MSSPLGADKVVTNLIWKTPTVAKYWETIVDKLKADGWEVRWVEAMHDGESGWTATAVCGKERHSTHANDITLAFQELEASCDQRTRIAGQSLK